jgi:hypothetical protein
MIVNSFISADSNTSAEPDNFDTIPCDITIENSCEEENPNPFRIIEKKDRKIAIVDFLNLTRKYISDRADAKFYSIEEFVDHIRQIAINLRSYGNFQKIYLVTKWLQLPGLISYRQMPKIILWHFCKAVTEWSNITILVLVNGLNDKDKESDDRALFILYNEYAKNATNDCVIFSHDNFASIKSHFLRKCTLKFYFAENIGDSWQKSKIISKEKVSYDQYKNLEQKSYNVIYPNDGTKILITIES